MDRYDNFDDHTHCASRDHMLKGFWDFIFCKSLTINLYLAMFGGQLSSTNGDITYLICHVTSKNYVIEESRVGAPNCTSQPCLVWWPLELW